MSFDIFNPEQLGPAKGWNKASSNKLEDRIAKGEWTSSVNARRSPTNSTGRSAFWNACATRSSGRSERAISRSRLRSRNASNSVEVITVMVGIPT